MDILGKFEPTKKSLPVFTALIEARCPPEGQKARSAEEMIIREGKSYGRDKFPDPFASFVDAVQDKLSSVGRSLVNVLRWRYAQEGPPSAIASRGLFFSNDAGATWYPVPGRYFIKFTLRQGSVFDPRDADVNEVRRFLSKDVEPPVYHELLREAKELQTSSPKSSVILAISAAEIAVKSVIVSRVPESTWLLDNIQSPPVVRMLIQYLPALFPREQQLYELQNKSGLIKTIEGGVQIRNLMVHKGSSPPAGENVIEIIRAVQELLWICDYYSGHLWAEQHINAMRHLGSEGREEK